MEEIVHTLNTENVDTTHQFIAAVCIAGCILECEVHNMKQEEFVYCLLKMLRVQPNMDHLVCPNVSSLFDVIDKGVVVR